MEAVVGIHETVLLYQGDRGRPRARRMLTEMNPTQQRLHDLFGLDAFAPQPSVRYYTRVGRNLLLTCDKAASPPNSQESTASVS
jgi:hypothetical protein